MDNRSNILSCALELFASRGYDAVGVQEIVDAAGITKPTLYHYFGSKRGLLDALLKEHFDELYESVTRAADYKHNLPMTLNALTGAYFAFAKNTARSTGCNYPCGLRLKSARLSGRCRASMRCSRSYWKICSFVRPKITATCGVVTALYAATFLGMINTYIGLSLNGYTEIDDKLVYKAVHQFMHGIFS